MNENEYELNHDQGSVLSEKPPVIPAYEHGR